MVTDHELCNQSLIYVTFSNYKQTNKQKNLSEPQFPHLKMKSSNSN